MDLIDKLEELEETENGVEAETVVNAGILPVDSLVDTQLHESIVVNGPPDDDNLLDIVNLRRDLNFTELILNLHIHLLSHFLGFLLIDT